MRREERMKAAEYDMALTRTPVPVAAFIASRSFVVRRVERHRKR